MRDATTALLLGALLGSVGACSTNELGRIEATELGDLSHGEPPREAFDAASAEACGAAAWSPRGRFALTRRPHVQKVGPSTATVVWRSRHEAAITLRSWDGDEVLAVPSELDPDAPVAAQRLARFEGLSPSTTYCFELADEQGLWVSGVGFRAAPEPKGATVRFSAFGDLGTVTPDQLAVLEQLKTVRSDFVLVAGDVAYEDGTREELSEHFFGVYRDVLVHVPFFPASGNHDYHTDDAAPFREAFVLPDNGGPGGIERWYSFDWGPLHVVVLDTEKLGTVQSAWLARDLAGHDRPWTVAVTHRPPYSSGEHGSDREVRELFGPLFEAHEVQLVLSGHDHDYERMKAIDGVTYVVTGAGGVGTRDVGVSDFTVFSQAVSHFVHVVVDDAQLTLWAIDGTGQIFDTLQLSR